MFEVKKIKTTVSNEGLGGLCEDIYLKALAETLEGEYPEADIFIRLLTNVFGHRPEVEVYCSAGDEAEYLEEVGSDELEAFEEEEKENVLNLLERAFKLACERA